MLLSKRELLCKTSQLSPLIQVFGAPGLSFISFWIALSLVGYLKSKRIDKLCPLVLGILLTFNTLYLFNRPNKILDGKLNLRIVQANVGNYMKVQAEKGVASAMADVIEFYKVESLKDSQQQLDLIIWPETAFPRLLSARLMKSSPAYVPAIVGEVVKTTGAELFFGGYDQLNPPQGLLDDFENEANTAFHIGRDGLLKELYHKVFLIPFGETLPFGPLTRFASQYITNISYFAKGNRFALFKHENGATFSASICYEVLFSSFMRDSVNSLDEQPNFIINLTNDSWYGDTSEPLQHKFLAKWRAVEFNMPIVRSTNTGITSVLYSDGSESNALGVGEKNSLDLTLKYNTNNTKTFFLRFGLLGLLLLALGSFLIELILSRLAKRKALS